MEEILTYYNEKAKNYDATYSILCFKVLDAITWKHLEPYLPTNANAFVLERARLERRKGSKPLGITTP